MTEVRARQALSAGGVAVVVGAVAAAYLVVGSGGSGGSKAKADTPVTTQNVVTVDGTGQAAGTPDTMVTTLGVDVRGATPAAALDGANKSMAVVQKAFRSRGVAAKDLKTTGLSVNPVYVYGKGKQVLHGYEANEQLQATLRNLATAGHTISAVVAVGGKSVTMEGIALDLEADGTLVKTARSDAYNDAKAKAQQYATLAGRTLGPVVSVSEHVNPPSGDSFPYAAAASAAAGAASVPIQAGSQAVSVNVTVVWTLS